MVGRQLLIWGGDPADEGAELQNSPRHSTRVLSRDNLMSTSAVSEVAQVSMREPTPSLDQAKLSDGRSYWCIDQEEETSPSYDRVYQGDLAGPQSPSSSYDYEDMLGAGSLRDPNNYSKKRGAPLNWEKII
ncbi:hypothetical protein AB5N19_09654 [Seiridium cardinale]|uniref:Uncharacterized protein n=1 Tax=Seiridium cardinale TaxID=138064 RepID=A0ABR2X7M1_9PEZI